MLLGLRAAKFGRVINVTSLVTRGLAFGASYAAAKAALENLTRTMAIELAADGQRLFVDRGASLETL